MKVQLKKAILDLQGKEVKNGNEVFTAENAVIQALTVMGEHEKNLSGDDRYKRFKIAQKVATAESEVDLKVEEIAEVKKVVGAMWAPLVVGRVFDILEGE